MVSNSIFIAFIFAFTMTTVFPAALLIVLGVRKKITLVPLLAGFAAFFLSQIILRMPLMSFLTTQGFWQPIMKNLLLYMVIISLTAGLFEETARLICAKLLKQHRTFQDSLSYGLGHGICEVILLTGIAHAGNLALCFFLRSNDTQAISSLLSGGELEALASQLEALTPVSIYLGVLERISAVMFHIFATTLIFQGVNRKKSFTYWLYAVTAHMLFNFVGVVLAQYAGLYASEGAMFLLALAGIYYVWKEKNSFPVPEKEVPVKKHFPV